MARAAHGIDYLAELDAMRDAYVKALPWQRLSVIRLRLIIPSTWWADASRPALN